MKTFTNVNARGLQEAVALARQVRGDDLSVSFASGGSDLLGLIKDRVVEPDVIVHLKTIGALDQVTSSSEGVSIGGLVTLEELHRHEVIRSQYPVLAEAAESVATLQIRNVGTLAGNVCQRPWCWYFRNGFPCFKAGGDRCFSPTGENQLHAIFGGGPSYIVHPSDTAPALVALDARFRIVGPDGERVVPATEFFVLPRENAAQENVLGAEEVLASIELPSSSSGTRSTYHKVMDREAWTHAVVSAAFVLEMDGQVVRSARVVLGGVAPIPWRVPAVERLLTGQRITEELAERAGSAAVEGAQPLSKNAYKVPLTRGVVRRTLLALAV